MRLDNLLYKFLLRCSRRFICFRAAGLSILALALVASPAATGFAEVTPLAPLPSYTPWTNQYETRQYLVHEAETKARLLAKGALRDKGQLMKAVPGKEGRYQFDRSLFEGFWAPLDWDALVDALMLS